MFYSSGSRVSFFVEKAQKGADPGSKKKNAQSSAGQSWIQWQPHGNREKTGRSHPAQVGPHRKKRRGQATTKTANTSKNLHERYRTRSRKTDRVGKKTSFPGEKRRKQTRNQSKTIAKHRGDKQRKHKIPGKTSFSSRPCLYRLKVGGNPQKNDPKKNGQHFPL